MDARRQKTQKKEKKVKPCDGVDGEERSGGAVCPIDRRESCFGFGPFGESCGVSELTKEIRVQFV